MLALLLCVNGICSPVAQVQCPVGYHRCNGYDFASLNVEPFASPVRVWLVTDLVFRDGIE